MLFSVIGRSVHRPKNVFKMHQHWFTIEDDLFYRGAQLFIPFQLRLQEFKILYDESHSGIN